MGPACNYVAISADGNGHPFEAPGALAYNGGSLFIATNDGVVHSYNENDFLIAFELLYKYRNLDASLMLETAKFADAASSGPTGIAFDPQGNVYVSYMSLRALGMEEGFDVGFEMSGNATALREMTPPRFAPLSRLSMLRCWCSEPRLGPTPAHSTLREFSYVKLSRRWRFLLRNHAHRDIAHLS